MPVYDQVKQALQDILAPEIHALKAEIKRLDERISGLEEKVNARISGLEEKLNARISGLEEKMNARLSSVEEKLSTLEEKMDACRRVAPGNDRAKYASGGKDRQR